MRKTVVGIGAAAVGLASMAWLVSARSEAAPPATPPGVAKAGWDATIDATAKSLLKDGRRTFRFDTFGSESFFGGALGLHRAIAGQALGGVGGGVSPATALAVGLKVDLDALPQTVVDAIAQGNVNLNDPAVTLALLQLDAVVGLDGQFDPSGALKSVGVTCALCHSTVDDAFAPGIGHRLDGWPNRDLNVGVILSLAPDLTPIANTLGVSVATVKTVLLSWGPGRYDAVLNQDGKAFRPDGTSAATVIPAAFGLAGHNLHTYTGWGSVPYWNSYVAVTQMRGEGTFYDPRLKDATRFPVAAREGHDDIRSQKDRVTPKLAELQFYQLAIPAPKPPVGSFDAGAAERGEKVFKGPAACARCHVPPLYSEPGWAMHTGAEIGIDDFQAQRSPDGRYRTTPLAGLFTRAKGGFYHDGRFATLGAVVDHYDRHFSLRLSAADRADLIEFLKSL